jgi:membrane associated rhomboid family serine protease
MVIPLYDNDPLEKSRRAYVNWALIAACTAIYLAQEGGSDNTQTIIIRDFALYPVALTGEAVTGGPLPPALSVLTYMFLHGGWLHLVFNMLFLFTFGDNIEDALGHGRYLVFYLVCGMGAGLVHAFASPESNVPLVGASGAIAGVVAAYLMLRPCARITFLVFGVIPLRLGSAWVLGFWILVQVWHIISDDKGDTAWWAHIGGLGVGALLVTVMRPPGVPLFDCMRPGDAVVASVPAPVPAPTSGSSGGPWSPR